MGLPINWKNVQLGSIGEFKNGVNFSKGVKGEGLRLINVKDLFTDSPYIDFEELDKVNLVNQKGIEKFYVQKGDLFFSRSSVKRDGVGVVSMARKTDKEVIHCGFVIRFRLTTKEVNPLFLTYILRSDYYRQVIIGISGGSAIINVSQDSLSSLEINLPPLNTQRKICSILSAYDDLIENNTRRIKILEEMAQTLYHEWFVKFRFPGYEQVKMVESELGLIPEGWEVRKLGDIVIDIIDYRGKTPKKLGGDWSKSGIKAISALNVKAGKLINLEKSKLVSEELYKKWMKSELKQGDILMTSEAPLGELYILVRKHKFCLSQRLYSIRANSQLIKPEILYFTLSSSLIQGEITARQSGTTVLGIRQTELRKVPIIIPPIQLQTDAASKLKQFLKAIDTLQQKNKNLRATRDLLLPKLISGEIDVENLEIDTGKIAA